MAGTRVQFDTRPLRRWERLFKRLPKDLPDQVVDEWTTATDIFFDRSQGAVHILSGDLKASGRSEVRREGPDEVVGEVIYGGVQGTEGYVDYGDYELDRGGDHDWMGIAWEQSEHEFADALTRAWRHVMGG